MPVFWDSAAIEVKGKQAKRTYRDAPQLWLRGLFVGRLQVGGRLAPDCADAVGTWRTQITEDLDPLLPSDAKVWVMMDNAYYRRTIVKELELDARGWDFPSRSPTNGTRRR